VIWLEIWTPYLVMYRLLHDAARVTGSQALQAAADKYLYLAGSSQ